MRALARSERSAAAVERARGRGGARRPRAIRARCGRGRRDARSPFTSPPTWASGGRGRSSSRGNVTGTENALAAARAAGVRRFVHCGTEAALLAGEPLRSVDETAPLRPDSKALYSSTKALAEQAVRAAERRRLRAGRAQAADGLGRGRHDAAAGDRRGGRSGQVRLGRRRRAPDRHHPRRQRGRGPAAWRGARSPRRGLLRHRRRAGRLPRVRLGAARDPGRRAADPLAAGLAGGRLPPPAPRGPGACCGSGASRR